MPNRSSIDSDNKEVGSVGGSVAIQAQHSQVDGDQLIAARDIHFNQHTHNYPPSSEERNKSEAQLQKDALVLQHYLQNFYKQEACYLTPISNEDEKKWPIAKTYRQLAIVIKDKQEYEVLEEYPDSVGRTNQLASYELNYESYEKRSITVEGLFDKSVISQKVVEGDNEELTELLRWQRLLVTGRAGVGKSTLLQYMAYRWALTEPEEQVASLWRSEYSLVFWLPLKLLHREDNLCHQREATDYERLAFFISKACQLEYCELFKGQDRQTSQRTLVQLLGEKGQKILLLVDSFDEASHWLRDDKETSQQWLLHSLFRWQGPMIVTTRPYAQASIPSTWSIEQLVHNEGFLGADIERYVEYYFKDTPEKSQALIGILKANVGAWGLAHVPLMARLLCFYWQTATENKEQRSSGIGAMSSLTSIMGLLVESVRVRTVLHRKRRREAVTSRRNSLTGQPLADLHYPKKTVLAEAEMAIELDALGELAFEALRAGQNQVLSIELQQRIFKKHYASLLGSDKASTYNSANELFIAAKRLGLLQVVSKDQGGKLQDNPMDCEHVFIHLLFQEYLAARYIVKHLDDDEYGYYELLSIKKPPNDKKERRPGYYLYRVKGKTYVLVVNSADNKKTFCLSDFAQEKEKKKALRELQWPKTGPCVVSLAPILTELIQEQCADDFIHPLHSFIQANRYLPRYQHVFGFVAGIAQAEEEKDEDSDVLATFFCQLDDETVFSRDLVGHYERLLKIRCLEESRRDGVPSEQEKAWLKDIAQWITALLLSDNYDENNGLHRQLEESQGVFSDPIILQAFVAPLERVDVPDSIKKEIIKSIIQGPRNDALIRRLVKLLNPSVNAISDAVKKVLAYQLAEDTKEVNLTGPQLLGIEMPESLADGMHYRSSAYEKDTAVVESLLPMLRESPPVLGAVVLERLAYAVGCRMNSDTVEPALKQSVLSLLYEPPPILGTGVLAGLVYGVVESLRYGQVDTAVLESVLGLLRELPSTLDVEMLTNLAKGVVESLRYGQADAAVLESVLGLLRELPSTLDVKVLASLAEGVSEHLRYGQVDVAVLESVLGLLRELPSTLDVKVLVSLAKGVGYSVGNEQAAVVVLSLLREPPSAWDKKVIMSLAEGVSEHLRYGQVDAAVLESMLGLLREPSLVLDVKMLASLAKGVGYSVGNEQAAAAVLSLLREPPSAWNKKVIMSLAEGIIGYLHRDEADAVVLESVLGLLRESPLASDVKMLASLAKGVDCIVGNKQTNMMVLESVLGLLHEPPLALDAKVLTSLAKGIGCSVGNRQIGMVALESMLDLLREPPSGLDKKIIISLAKGIKESLKYGQVNTVVMQLVLSLLHEPPPVLDANLLASLAKYTCNSLGYGKGDTMVVESMLVLLREPPSGLDKKVIMSLAEGLEANLRYGWIINAAVLGSLVDLLREPPRALSKKASMSLMNAVKENLWNNQVDTAVLKSVLGLLWSPPPVLDVKFLMSLADGVVRYLATQSEIPNAVQKMILELLIIGNERLFTAIEIRLLSALNKVSVEKLVDCLANMSPWAYDKLFEAILCRLREENGALFKTREGLVFSLGNKFYEARELTKEIIDKLSIYIRTEQQKFIFQNVYDMQRYTREGNAGVKNKKNYLKEENYPSDSNDTGKEENSNLPKSPQSPLPSNNLFSPSTTTFFHPLREANLASSKLDDIFSIESQVNVLKRAGH